VKLVGGRAGILFVIAAPSGTGKSTVAQNVLERVAGLEFSISYTTRPPRDGEQDGKHYHFVDPEQFEQMRAEQAFLEHAEVFGNSYATGREETDNKLGLGRDLLLDIDVQGARQVRRAQIDAVSIMILPPDYATLATRLRDRASESEQQRARRLAEAREELEEFDTFDYLVVNEDLEISVTDICSIVRAERRRTRRIGGDARRILATFPE
jgi:guanylate kinase